MGAVSSHCHIQRHRVGSLEMATDRVFTPGQLAGTAMGISWVWFCFVPQLAITPSPAHQSLEGIMDLTQGPLFYKDGHPPFLKLPKQF